MKSHKNVIAAGTRVESVEQVKQRFAQWRTNRPRGQRIPRTLWAAAVELASQGDAKGVAHELRVDYAGLMRRLGGGGVVASTGAEHPQFVEWVAPPVLGGGQCVIEMHNARGAKVRIEIKGGDLPGCVAGVSRSFWSAP